MQYDEFIARLKRPKRKGDHQYDCQCPAHDDANQSLSVGLSDDGQRIMVFCQAKCSTLHVLQSLGLKMSDLFIDGKIPKRGKQPSRIVATYDYTSADGDLLYQKCRYEPKDFRQRKPDGNGGWSWSLNGTPRVLYRLPDLLASECEWVFVVEGEKDADNCHAIGLPATCNDGGAGKWDKVGDDSALHNRNICIIADKDKPGRAHADDVARRLMGKASVVKVVELPGGHVKDVSDWISGGGTADQLLQIASTAPAFDPKTPPPTPTDTTNNDRPKLGERDPETGKLVLSPKKTLPTASAYVEEFATERGARTIHNYAGVFWRWQDNHYSTIDEEQVRHQLQPWLDQAMRYSQNQKTGEMDLIPFDSNPGTIKSALDTIKTFVYVPSDVSPPAWLDKSPDLPAAKDLLVCRKKVVFLPKLTDVEPSPKLFVTAALDFDYDIDAPWPTRWIKFLEQVFADDPDQIGLLQQWFGYCLTADTSQQKMMLLVGAPRSGKGTIARILQKLIGTGNCVGPTIGSLAGTFGLQPLIGKSLAVVSDARFTGDNVASVVERFLCISGEDTLTIDRKFLPSVSMKLSTRFIFLTNEFPRLNETSGALARRFLILRFKQSFLGREDTHLDAILTSELPGILNWAVEGWHSLRQAGRFTSPQTCEESINDLEDMLSPVGCFVRDRCTVGPDKRVWVDDIFKAWRTWCEEEGRDRVGTKNGFGRDLMAAVPSVAIRRNRSTGRFYDGIDLGTDEPAAE